MKIVMETIPKIEDALGVEFTEDQKAYLLYDKPMPSKPRQNGKTYIHAVKLALSEGEPLDFSCPTQFSDYPVLSSIHDLDNYARYSYLPMYQKIMDKLENAGFEVRDVKIDFVRRCQYGQKRLQAPSEKCTSESSIREDVRS